MWHHACQRSWKAQASKPPCPIPKKPLTPFSGFQRQSSGIAVIDTATDTLIGILPSNGGHHDCVIIPTRLEHMKHTRSCTL